MYYSQGLIKRHDIADLQMPDSTLVSIDRQKRMRTTPVSGGYGTVKEIFGFDDWKITAEGITDDENTLRGLKELECLSDAIGVENSDLFEYYDIFHVVIQHISLRQHRGKGALTGFTIEMLSDEPVQLIWSS